MILAIDTSGHDLHIGLFSDAAGLVEEFHYVVSEEERAVHDALLAKRTSELLEKNSASVKDISKIALVIGPGSFTGLRIGLAFAKGLAFGLGAAIIPIKTDGAITLQRLAELSLISAPEEDTSSLEPFYGTDFKPKPL